MITLTDPAVLEAFEKKDGKALMRLQLLAPERETRSQAASAGRRLATERKYARLAAEQGQDSLDTKVSIQGLDTPHAPGSLVRPELNQTQLSQIPEVPGILTARDLTALQRRRLFNRMVRAIDAGLVATVPVVRCDACRKALGAPVERPDWTARNRNADLVMALLGSSAPKQLPATQRKGPVSREPEWLRKMRSTGPASVPATSGLTTEPATSGASTSAISHTSA